MARSILPTLLAFVLLWPAACKKPSAPAVADAAPPPAPRPPAEPYGLRVYGALKAIMHHGKTGSAVSLRTLKAGRDLYGLGALSGLRGEVTIVEGQVWTSYPKTGSSFRTHRASSSREDAALLVTARVPAWQAVVLQTDVPFERIDKTIARLAATRGVDIGKPFPFLIAGLLRDLEWHVIDGRRFGGGSASHADHKRGSVQGIFKEIRGALVGFHSPRHHGVFTHHDSNTHMHVLLEKPALTGHVDRVTLPRGTLVKLPKATAARK